MHTLKRDNWKVKNKMKVSWTTNHPRGFIIMWKRGYFQVIWEKEYFGCWNHKRKKGYYKMRTNKIKW